MKKTIIPSLTFLSLILLFSLYSCAQGPDSSSPSKPGSGGSQAFDNITFTLRINDAGKLSSGGYYIILLNSNDQAIEVTNPGTYTDAIRFYLDPNSGYTYTWFHRVQSVPGPGYEFVSTARIDEFAQISSDSRALSYLFKLKDSTCIFNQYIFNRFTAHVVTTDTYQSAILGRTLDTLGPGPDITHNDEYTVFVSKALGPENPLPPNYPSDNLYDWDTKSDLPADFPYINFDIESFQINVF